MKANYLIILLACFLLSCSSSNNDVLDLYNGASIQLSTGEMVAKPNKASFKQYEKLLSAVSYAKTAPLYRVINSENYSIYVGLLIDDTSKQQNTECQSTIIDGNQSISYIEELSTDMNKVLLLLETKQQDSLSNCSLLESRISIE